MTMTIKTVVEDTIKTVAKRARRKGLKPQLTEIGERESFLLRKVGNFTVFAVQREDISFLGIAKRNPEDRSDGLTGVRIAVSRAVYDSIKLEQSEG